MSPTNHATVQEAEKRPALLLVDDEPLNRMAMRRIFRTLYPYFEIREANDGEEALDLLDDDVVLVIADISMPRLDGIRMCWSIRNSAFCAPWKDVPVILVSALCFNEEAVLSAWAAGTALILPKPFPPSDLATAVLGTTGFRPARESHTQPAELRVPFPPESGAKEKTPRARPRPLLAAPQGVRS